jgi:hypothetical protein
MVNLFMIDQPLTISVGITVRSDTSFIHSLIETLLSVAEQEYRIGQIIVLNHTSKKIRNVPSDSRISVIQFTKKRTNAQALKRLFSKATGAVTVHIDSQIETLTISSLSNLIRPFLKEKTVMGVGGRVVPKEPKGFIELSLANYVHSRIAIEHLFDPVQYMYSFPFAFFAIHSGYAKTIAIPKTIGLVDAFLYLQLQKSGQMVVYSRQAQVSLPLPATHSSAVRSIRQKQKDYKQLASYFSPALLGSALHLAWQMNVQVAFLDFITNPFGLFYRLYLSFVGYLQELDAHERRRILYSDRKMRLEQSTYRPLARI